MSYQRGPSRSEVQLLPPAIEDYVPSNSPVRFLDAFVDNLDLQTAGFLHTQPSFIGRPPYHPADLLKLYLYGYLNRIRSSRRLEAEAYRNLEVIWLLRGLRPDFKTIADFRRDNRHAFKSVFKTFNLLCRKLNLFGSELVAIDGSKFKAVNSARKNFSQKKLAELIEKIENRIDHHLSELDIEDSEAEGITESQTVQQLKEKVAVLEKRKGKYNELLTEMQKAKKNEVSLIDSDAALMKGPHCFLVGYNVQIAVDSRYDLIVVEDVVSAANDTGQLGAMATGAKTELEAPTLKAVADTGYHSADELEKCEKAGIETFVPASEKAIPKDGKGHALFEKKKFKYDCATDTYTCPAGAALSEKRTEINHGKQRSRYYNIAACKECGLKTQCTIGAFRNIARLPNEAVVERAAVRTQNHPDMVQSRKEIVEHVFGTLRTWECDNFLMRGLEKVRAEFSLSALAYNLKRAMNLVPMTELLAAVRQK